MRLVKDDLIDFDKYLAGPAEAAHVRSAATWWDEVLDRFQHGFQITGAKLPWVNVRDRLRVRPSEVTIWAGINGHGKTLLTSQVMLGLMTQGEKVCIASFEMAPTATLYRMTRQALGLTKAVDDNIKRFMSWADERLWIYDQQNRIKPERVIALARYCLQELGIQHLVVDSLMKCGIGSDDYNGQKQFVDELCTAARDTGLHIHLVAHSRKSQSEDRPIGKFDIKGASEITDLVDNVFTLWRDKPKEDMRARGQSVDIERPDAILTCDKARHGEWEGRINLWFSPGTMQFTLRDAAPTCYLDQINAPAEVAC
jgi:twinkle protein